MNMKAENTLARLRRDLVQSVEAQAASFSHASYSTDADKAAAKHIFDRRERIVDSLIEHLRRNWTVTERARPQRRVPPR